MIKNLYKKKKIEGLEYLCLDSGEIIDFSNVTSLNEIDNNELLISSKEYVVIDTKSFNLVKTKLNNIDLSRIIFLGNMVKGNYNMVYYNNKPLDKFKLKELLELTRNSFNNFMNKLLKNSVIAYIITYKNRKKHTYIMINPTFIRKGKIYNKSCMSVFKDLSV